MNMLRIELDSDVDFVLGQLNVLEEEIYETFRQENETLEESQSGFPNPNEL